MKKGCLIAIIAVVVIGIILYSFFAGSYNKMVQMDENVKEKWSQVENVYQRRYDLIPNLVETVRGYAAHEQETFKMVTEARAKAGGTLQVSDDVLNDPQKFQQFQQAQANLGNALQRLMVVVERYPELKANQNFLALQDQLEGTENRIAVERKRFNQAARQYNTYIKQFPQVILANLYGFQTKQYFESVTGAETAPEVNF
ncbi:MAG TPA: LemA family protein [Candidatus Cloacimonas sp.]|nr:LemA protein [Candidatus Cloacimonadota bacterium]HCX73634.1 LemA family protein [Candidatus Cloacimonas sp.]